MLTIRHFNPTEAEYEEICRVYNAEWPDMPATAENIMLRDKQHDPKYLYQRFVAELAGKIVVAGTYNDPSYGCKPGKFRVRWNVDPTYAGYTDGNDGIHQIIFNYTLRELSTHEPKQLVTSMREDRTERVQFLLDNGFEFQMRGPRSELQIADFDFGRYVSISEKMVEQGIEIRTLAQLMESDPDWLSKTYELCWDLEQDVPSPEPPTKHPIEEWQKQFDSPNCLAEGWFIAIDGADYVGISMLAISDARPDLMHTWLTGTIRSHRRKGIATALKVCAINLAKEYGAKVLDTFNEENNPMYDLNVQLGFKAQAAWVDYRKILK